MNLVATLISQDSALDAAQALARAAPQGRILRELDGVQVIDVGFPAPDVSRGNWRSWAAERVDLSHLDIVIQPDDDFRRKKLLIADMDSTIIEQECIDELADYAGVKAHVAAITERAMRGEIAFEPALRERVALLRGLPIHLVGEVIAQRITLTPGARTLVATMQRNGAFTALVSGGFDVFTGPIASMIGFDMNKANRLLTQHGVFTGEVAEPILGRAAKKAALEALVRKHDLGPAATIAVGDGANDLDMIQASGLGIAFRAKPAVAAAAHAAVGHHDLTALLFAQGYARTEFVEA